MLSSLDLVKRGYAKTLRALALASVVVILLCIIKEIVRFLRSAFLWADFLPKWLSLLP